MSKSILTIHKEVEKKEYEKTPLGQAEKKLRAFYDEAYLKDNPIPEDILKQIDTIREEQAKKYDDYIQERMRIDKEWIDTELLNAMTREISLLEKR
jgi:hypothetical protein